MNQETPSSSASPNPLPGAGLVRDLKLFDITMVGVGAMIGAGIFVLTGIAAGTAGPALLLAFALNGVVTLFTAMAYAELGSAIPEAGGGYLWVKEGLPSWNAFLAGWMSWFAHAVAGSLYALGFGSYTWLVLHTFGVTLFGLPQELTQKILAVVAAAAFVAINFKGVSETGKIGNIVTLAKIAILGLFVASGLYAIVTHPQYLNKFTPFAPNGLSGVFMAMGLTFIAFEGYEIIVQAGEEVENPRKNIPRAVFLSLLIVIPIYLLVAFTCLGAVNTANGEPTWQWLGAHAELGLAEAARQFMPLGTTLLLIGGLLSTMSALNATTFSSTRVSFAMGRDRNLPDAFAKIHQRTRTPFMALIFSGLLIIAMAVAIPIEAVAAAADVMFLLLFLQVNIAVMTIRRKYGDKLNYGYIMPFGPVLPSVNILLILFLAAFMFHFSALGWFFVLGWIAAGLVIYFLYASRREMKKTETPVVLRQRLGDNEPRPFRVLVPLANPQSADMMIQLAARLAKPMEGELLLLHAALVPRQTPLIGSTRELRPLRKMIDEAAARAEKTGLPHESIVRLAHAPSLAITQTARQQKADIVVLGWRGATHDPHRRLGRNIDRVMRDSASHVLAVQQSVKVPARRILVPVANPAHGRLLAAIGLALLDQESPHHKVTLLHLTPPGMEKTVRDKRIETLREKIEQPAALDGSDDGEPIVLDGRPISLEIEESTDVVHYLIEQTRQADLLILGSSEPSWFRRRMFQALPYRVALHAHCPVIMVNQATHPWKLGVQQFFNFFLTLDEAGEREAEEVSAQHEEPKHKKDAAS